MKPTDKKHPIEINSRSVPEAPAVSRLKRVIDIKSLEPEKVKTSHHSSTKRDNAKPVPKQDNAAVYKKNHKNRNVSNAPLPTRDPGIKPSATGSVPKADEKPRKIHRVTPRNIQKNDVPAPKPSRPNTPSVVPEESIKTVIPRTESITPQSPVTPSSDNAQVSSRPTHHIRATRVIRAKNKIPMHVSESFNTPAKNRFAMKSRKHAPNRVHTDLSQKSYATDNITEKIEEALLLQSWRAKQWNLCITSLDPNIQARMLKCLPLVQARLVNNLCITAGSLEATIIDQVTSITLRQFTPGQWRSVISMLSDRAIFTTSLLNGELPEGILSIFKQASLSLFPGKLKDFTFTCTCGSDCVPCEHACALLLTFALALEEDPFQILTLRGMTRDELLSQLRDARSDQVVDEKNRYRINYEMPAQNVNFDEFYTPHGNFDELKFHISSADNPLIKCLGNPVPWQAPVSLNEIITTISKIASHEAEIIGLNDHPASTSDTSHLQRRQDESRAPKKINKNQRFTMPNLKFLYELIPKDILDTISGDPIDTGADIIRWLKLRGASDIRTLARRTRLHKETIESFLEAFCKAGLVTKEGDEEHCRFVATF